MTQEPSISAASKRQNKREDKKASAYPTNKIDDKKLYDKSKNIENFN